MTNLTEHQLRDFLASKGFRFINKLVKACGGKRKGNRLQDINEIVAIWKGKPSLVESNISTMVVSADARKQKVKNAFEFVGTSWGLILDKLSELEGLCDEIENAVQDIDTFLNRFKN